MSDIIITEFMDEAAVAGLRSQFDLHWDEDLWDKPGELRRLARDCRGIVVRNRTQVDAELLIAAPVLQVVARLGVGLDNINLDACKARGIEVCTAIGANATSVAEYVIATAMALLRGGALRGTSLLSMGAWPRREFGRGREIAGKTLGIIGFGSIGQVTGQLAKAIGMKVIAHDQFLPADAAPWREAERLSLDALLATADVISLHCPLSKETRGLIGSAEFEQMKPGAILINAARGGIVDEAACAQALRSGHLGGAAFDCLATEPIDNATAALFGGLPNVLLSPHIAGVTVEANQRISEIAADNVRRVLARSVSRRANQH